MQDADLVRGPQSRTQLPRNVPGLLARHPANPSKQRRERFAVDVLHRQIVPAGRVADVVDAADIRMRDVARQPHLRDELLHLPFPHRRNGEKLERDRLANPQVVGAVHLPHCATTEQADDSIPSGKDVTRRKACVANRIPYGELIVRSTGIVTGRRPPCIGRDGDGLGGTHARRRRATLQDTGHRVRRRGMLPEHRAHRTIRACYESACAAASIGVSYGQSSARDGPCDRARRLERRHAADTGPSHLRTRTAARSASCGSRSCW